MLYNPWMFHELQPFKIVFKKLKDGAMERNNYIELNKVTLVRWVHKVLEQTLLKYIRFGFRATWTLPLNPKVMDKKFNFVEIYITQPTNREEIKHFNS
jgi:hypothetical protein